MVGTEEGVESETLGQLSDRDELVVAGALLGFGEDAQVHRRARYRGDATVSSDSIRGRLASDRIRGAVSRSLRSVLRIDEVPELYRPVLVYSMRGWVDAGSAGEGAVDLLVEQMGASGATMFAWVDLSDVCDLQQTRPSVRLVDGSLREIEWPRIEVWGGALGRDLVVMRGPEPSIRWQHVIRTVNTLVAQLGIREAYGLAGMPAIMSHRRPVPVRASATKRSVAQEVGPLRDDYAGATGFNTAFQYALTDLQIRSIGLWAQVPQYVAGSPSPPAVRSLLSRLAELARIEPSLGELDQRCSAYRDRVEEGLSERPEVLAFVEQIDRELDRQIPSGDELADEIEQFLRNQGDED